MSDARLVEFLTAMVMIAGGLILIASVALAFLAAWIMEPRRRRR